MSNKLYPRLLIHRVSATSALRCIAFRCILQMTCDIYWRQWVSKQRKRKDYRETVSMYAHKIDNKSQQHPVIAICLLMSKTRKTKCFILFFFVSVHLPYLKWVSVRVCVCVCVCVRVFVYCIFWKKGAQLAYMCREKSKHFFMIF